MTPPATTLEERVAQLDREVRYGFARVDDELTNIRIKVAGMRTPLAGLDKNAGSR